VTRKLLTEQTIRSLPVPSQGQLAYWDATFKTFGIRVSCGGSKTFVLKHQNRLHTLGRYPIISLKDARSEARRRLSTQHFPERLNPQSVIKDYLAIKARETRSSSFKHTERVLSKFTLTDFSKITARDVLGITKTRLDFALTKAFLTWCVGTQLILRSPLEGVKCPFKATQRARVLTDDELQLLWATTAPLTDFHRIVRLLLLTGQRLTQITHFENSWIRYDALLEFPAVIMKNNQVHVIPLTDEIRRHLPSFKKPFTNQSTAKKQLDAELQIPHWTLHDLRRTFSTKMSEWEICPIDITEAILSHTTGSRSQIQRIYDRHNRMSQIHRALKKYHRRLLALVEPPA